MYKAIFFDMDDTLYDQIQPFSMAHAKYFADRCPGISIHELFRTSRKYSDEVFEASERGEISMEEMYVYRLQNAYRDFGVTITRAEALSFQHYYAYCQHHIKLQPVVADMLEKLHGKMMLGLISNGPSIHQHAKASSMGLDRWLNPIIISGDLDNCMKPDVRIFRYTEKLIGLRPEEIIYVGDSQVADIPGAKAAGWSMVWFRRRGAVLDTSLKYKPDWTVETDEEMSSLLCQLADSK